MADLAFLALTIVCFALSWAFVVLCERLNMGPAGTREPKNPTTGAPRRQT